MKQKKQLQNNFYKTIKHAFKECYEVESLTEFSRGVWLKIICDWNAQTKHDFSTMIGTLTAQLKYLNELKDKTTDPDILEQISAISLVIMHYTSKLFTVGGVW